MPMPRVMLVVALALVAISCTSTRHSNLARFEKDLSLTVRNRQASAKTGSTLSLMFTLENRGTMAATACRYLESTVHFWGLDARYAVGRLGPVIDHQYCQVKFTIAPGGSIEWFEAVPVPNVPPGNVKLMASVRIVDPTDCDQYGCYDTNVSATSETPLAITAASK